MKSIALQLGNELWTSAAIWADVLAITPLPSSDIGISGNWFQLFFSWVDRPVCLAEFDGLSWQHKMCFYCCWPCALVSIDIYCYVTTDIWTKKKWKWFWSSPQPSLFCANEWLLAHLSRQALKVSLKYTHARASVQHPSSSVVRRATIFKDLLGQSESQIYV